MLQRIVHACRSCSCPCVLHRLPGPQALSELEALQRVAPGEASVAFQKGKLYKRLGNMTVGGEPREDVWDRQRGGGRTRTHGRPEGQAVLYKRLNDLRCVEGAAKPWRGDAVLPRFTVVPYLACRRASSRPKRPSYGGRNCRDPMHPLTRLTICARTVTCACFF